MKLLFKQRLFSWFDSYDVYDEAGNTAFQVHGQLSWGHCLQISGPDGQPIGTVKERVLTFLPRFELSVQGRHIGSVEKQLSLFTPRYRINCKGWTVTGNFLEWDYTIQNSTGTIVAVISKELFRLTDTYVLDIADSADALLVLMLVLAIDAEKCSRD